MKKLFLILFFFVLLAPEFAFAYECYEVHTSGGSYDLSGVYSDYSATLGYWKVIGEEKYLFINSGSYDVLDLTYPQSLASFYRNPPHNFLGGSWIPQYGGSVNSVDLVSCPTPPPLATSTASTTLSGYTGLNRSEMMFWGATFLFFISLGSWHNFSVLKYKKNDNQ